MKIIFAIVVMVCQFAFSSRAVSLTPAEQLTLQTALPGQVISLPELWPQQTNLAPLPLEFFPIFKAQLLLSDKPEYFRSGDGIAMQEVVKPGLVRLYLYHVPQPQAGPKTITAVIENLGDKPLHFRLLRRSVSKLGNDYFRIGKEGLIGFFNASPDPNIRQLAPGERMLIDPAIDAATATTDQLVHAFVEFQIDQPARISTLEHGPAISTFAALDSLPKLPRSLPGFGSDGAGRGLFLTNEFNVSISNQMVYDTAEGPRRIVITGGRQNHSILGRDSIEPGELHPDSGNYGVLYHVKIRFKSSDHRRLALLITKTAVGGRWCGAQSGAVKINGGEYPAGTIAIPSEQSHYGNPGEMVVIQKYRPPGFWHRTGVIELLYSPPGASCMPTPFILAPY